MLFENDDTPEDREKKAEIIRDLDEAGLNGDQLVAAAETIDRETRTACLHQLEAVLRLTNSIQLMLKDRVMEEAAKHERGEGSCNQDNKEN